MSRLARITPLVRSLAIAATCHAFAAATALAAQIGVPVAPRPTAPPPVRIVVNLPAYRLDAWEGNRRVASYRVGIGMKRYATPSGRWLIENVDWNPWWRPPASEWAANRTLTRPGPGNPLGRVRLNLFGEYHIHGYAGKTGLGRRSSHGCIRMANRDVVALARWIHRHDPSRVSTARLDSLVDNSRRTRSLPLARPVPVEVVYRTVEVQNDTLLLHPNVYGWASPNDAAKIERTLRAAGYAEPIPPKVARRLAGRSRAENGTVRHPLGGPGGLARSGASAPRAPQSAPSVR